MNSLAELPSERQCHRILFKTVYGSTNCPDCDGRLLFRRNYTWCKNCRRKYSVRSEIWFRYSNLPFQKIWLLIWCWQRKQDIKATKAIVGVSYPTIRRWFSSFRKSLPKLNLTLSGIVEIDESAFGKQKFGNQQWVVGAIERDTRHLRLSVVQSRDRDTLEQFTLDRVEQGSLVLSDAWYAYNELGLLGYDHEYCNHSKGHFGPTNMIENMWSVIKRHLTDLYGHLSFRDLPDILNEWEIRQNRPELMYNVTNYLRVTVCSGFVR